jgi:hypothetical protein
MAFKSCNHPIEIYISYFPLKLLCILIKTMLYMLIVFPHGNYPKNIMGINPSASWELPQEHHGIQPKYLMGITPRTS